MQQVGERLHEYATATPGLKICAKSTASGERATEKEQHFDILLHTIDAPNHERAKTGSSDPVFVGVVDVVEQSEPCAFEVVLAYGDGDRAEFWKMAENLKAVVVRTGRRWRRKTSKTNAS